MEKLSAEYVLFAIRGDKIEFSFTTVKSPISEADILFKIVVPANHVGLLLVTLRDLFEDNPEFLGFTKKG